MNEIRVERMLRELRCDPVTQGFDQLFSLGGRGAVTAIASLLVAAAVGIVAVNMHRMPELEVQGRVATNTPRSAGIEEPIPAL